MRIASPSLGPGDVALFQGTLSSYYLARIKSGAVPDTLAARQIPVVSWRAGGALLLAPARALLEGAYSLAASSGLVGEFRVAAPQPLLRRLWPPAFGGGTLSHAVYCGDGSAPLDLGALVFQPGDVSVVPVLGVDEVGLLADRCLHLESALDLGADQILVPPPMSGGWALDPAPFSGEAAGPVDALACPSEERAIGPGCARVEDDRVTVHTADSALLWIVHSVHGSVLEVTQSSAEFVLRGLSPASSERLWGRVYDRSGAALDFDLIAAMAPAWERPVLNEVLANPLGPEPQSEWIELVNDGTLALDLSHFALQDAGGSMPLPPASLAAHEYALLVREDFAPSPSDVPPAPGARLIPVRQLGNSGLANGGEMLALLAADSTVVSSLPALAPKAGQSLSRRHPYSPDDDPSAFSVGVPTPGVGNEQ